MDKKELEERLDLIEFRQELLFNNSNVDRLLFEFNITRNEYENIQDIMDEYSEKIENKDHVSNTRFENDIYNKIPHIKGNYHFCEELAIAFMEDGRWGDVFPAVYNNVPKYKAKIEEILSRNI